MSSVHPSSATSSADERVGAIDAMRGLAILLMLLDHLAAVFAPVQLMPMRVTVTRYAMPLFFGITGYLAAHRRRPPSWRRIVQAGTLGVGLSIALGTSAPIATPDVLLLWALIAPWAATIAAAPLLTVCATLPLAMNVRPPWRGYGLELVVWVAVGALAHRAVPSRRRRQLETATKQGTPTWVTGIGRHPLAIYGTHVALIAIVWRLR